MAWAKRIVLFLAVNVLVMVTISLLLIYWGAALSDAYGLDYQA